MTTKLQSKVFIIKYLFLDHSDGGFHSIISDFRLNLPKTIVYNFKSLVKKLFFSEYLTFPRRSWETLETWDCCWPCWPIEETQSPTLATAGATWSRTLSSDSLIRESSWSEESQAEVASFEQGESQTLDKWSETILKAVRVFVADSFYALWIMHFQMTF